MQFVSVYHEIMCKTGEEKARKQKFYYIQIYFTHEITSIGIPEIANF